MLLNLCLAVLVSFAGAEPEPATEWERSYRVWFTRSFGDDHVCLTEVTVLDENGMKMQATFKAQSSCYGCASCDGCKHRYGDPLRQFDGEEGNDDEDAWTCTAPGTFVNGLGSQNVIFTLKRRPSKLVLARPSMDGDWMPTDFSIEEQQDDGTWWIIASVTDAQKALEQAVDVPATGGQPLYDTIDLGPGWTYENQGEWAKSYPDCAGSQQSPIEIPATAPQGALEGLSNLSYIYEPLKMRALYNTGLGVQVAGNFGNLTLPSGVYDVRQFHIHMPSEHKIGDEAAVGELHIVHQKQGSRGTDDLVMVTIMLRLPREHEALVESEPFFMKLGLDNLPSDGSHSTPFDFDVDLNTFAPQLGGHFYAYRGSLATPPCTENVQHYVMANSAVISGSNVVAFKARWPALGNARARQSVGDRQILVDQVLEYEAPIDANFGSRSAYQ